ncbi:MAG: sugar phosphate isomerase/epimerase [Acidobacteriia bacterium]|nr:sugar phosphate isomerase/epimerase [Terriglobia bacterium]
MKKDVELIASYWTLAGGAEPHTDHEYSLFDFKDRVEACAKVGFKGIGIWHADLVHTLKRRPLTEIKRILDDNGMKHIELEFLGDWFLTGEKKKKSDIVKNDLLTAASLLGARHIKVGDFFHTDTPMAQVIESFAALCRDAKAHGTRIVYELMPFAMIDNLPDTLTMLKGAGAKNGGIIFDLWHVVKLDIPYEEVARFPMEYFFGVEINDGTFTAPWDLVEDTVNHRRLCGEGEFDVPGFLDHVWEAGYRGPIGVEVLNKELRQRPLDELATRSFNTTMAQFRP